MSDTNSVAMEAGSSVLDTATSSEFGSSLYANSVANNYYNYPSTAASIASSDAVYQHDLNSSYLTLPMSRPLSRASTTSCMSVTLFKDGVEGKRVHRNAIPTYPYNLMASMNEGRHLKSPLVQHEYSSMSNEDVSSNMSDNGIDDNLDKGPIDVPFGPPVSLTEKMKLLKTGQTQQNHIVDPNGPSVGPIVFGTNDDNDDVSMTDYAKFQKQAERDDANE